VVKVFLLNNIEKDLAGFSQDTFCVLVHGASSCDLGCCNIYGYG
jgi:hypothetical protein